MSVPRFNTFTNSRVDRVYKSVMLLQGENSPHPWSNISPRGPAMPVRLACFPSMASMDWYANSPNAHLDVNSTRLHHSRIVDPCRHLASGVQWVKAQQCDNVGEHKTESHEGDLYINPPFIGLQEKAHCIGGQCFREQLDEPGPVGT